MLIIHDGFGAITALQLFPPNSDFPHIVANDDLYELLEPFVIAGLHLAHDGEEFFLPDDIEARANILAFERIRTEKMRAIESAQMADLLLGVEFSFNGVTDTIQTRSERDLINISGIATKAMLLKGKGIEQAVIEFRAESNTSYMLTPDDAIALGEAVADRNQQIYSKAWLLKDAINAAESVQDLELLQW